MGRKQFAIAVSLLMAVVLVLWGGFKTPSKQLVSPVSETRGKLEPSPVVTGQLVTDEKVHDQLESDLRSVELDFENSTDCVFDELPPDLKIPEASPALLEHGRSLFRENCATCHSIDGHLAPFGSELDPRPTNLRQPAHYKYGNDVESILRTTAYGIPDTGMAPWGDILSEDELVNVALYVYSLQVVSH